MARRKRTPEQKEKARALNAKFRTQLRTYDLPEDTALRVRAGLYNVLYLDYGVGGKGSINTKRITVSKLKTFEAGGYVFDRYTGLVIKQYPYAIYPVAYSVPVSPMTRVTLDTIFEECNWNI
jgi:hypothetical protein